MLVVLFCLLVQIVPWIIFVILSGHVMWAHVGYHVVLLSLSEFAPQASTVWGVVWRCLPPGSHCSLPPPWLLLQQHCSPSKRHQIPQRQSSEATGHSGQSGEKNLLPFCVTYFHLAMKAQIIVALCLKELSWNNWKSSSNFHLQSFCSHKGHKTQEKAF